MLQLPDLLGSYAQYAVSATFFAGLIYLFNADILSFSWPKKDQIDRSIEEKSNLTQGYIGLLYDSLANPNTANTRTLWSEAQFKILHSLKRLKSPTMRPQLCREDPSALRYVAILIFVSGLFFSGSNWNNRILAGMLPFTPNWYSINQETTANLWITTPEYTQGGQLHIIGSPNVDSLNIPEGSSIRIRIYSKYGEWISPMLQNGNKKIALESLGDSLYGIETTIEDGEKIQISQGIFTKNSWHYNYIKDTPPEIWLPYTNIEKTDAKQQLHSEKSIQDKHKPDGDPPEEEPIKDNKQDKETTTGKSTQDTKIDSLEQIKESKKINSPPPYEVMENLSLRFSLNVKDDYSVKELGMRMDINPIVEDRPLGKPISEERLVISSPNEEFLISPTFDLTWHTWAGLPVQITFKAMDHRQQIAVLKPISLILPEREFEHPMAKSLIAMRKRLAWDYQDSFFDIARHLETLLDAPDYFQNNTVIYLAIRSASSRLLHHYAKDEDKKTDIAKEVIALLWEAALVIEDGNLSLAMRELQDAQQALENLMRDPNASEDEIAQHMQELREKMSNYFTELQRDMQKRMESGELKTLPSDQFDQIISPDMLSQMMEQLEQALRDGDEQKAQELMSQMQRMMEMMDPSMQSVLPMDMQMMKEGINELQELIERQEALLGQTRVQASALEKSKREKRKEQKPPPPSRNASPDLEEMLKDFGFDVAPPTPEPQTKAEESNSPDNASQEPKANTTPDVSGNETEQAALRYILGQLMLDAAEKLDDVPEKMGMAEQEMRNSEQALGRNQPDQSIPHQELAIQHLKEAQEDLARQFRSRMKQMIGISMSGRPNGGNRDPLGRPFDDQNDPNGKPHGSDVRVPDETEKKRVDEILKTLRDRSGDRSRSRDELDYFRRLLRQF